MNFYSLVVVGLQKGWTPVVPGGHLQLSPVHLSWGSDDKEQKKTEQIVPRVKPIWSVIGMEDYYRCPYSL